MAGRCEIVVTLDGRVIEADRPIVHADDPTFLRGDGVFETLLVRGGRACLLDAHLARLARSAAITGLPAPDLERWRSAVAAAEAQWTGDGEAVLRMTYGRGRGVGPTAFVTVSVLPDRVPAARRDGVSAMTLDRGVPAADGADVPWSITGAKSLSYGLNAAALHHAERLGFGDVILLSSDGCVLEGPRSSVLIVDGDGVLVTPPDSLPILAGTTVRAMFDVARSRGRACDHRTFGLGELLAAQGVWLVSSVTLAARVHTLDSSPLPAAPLAAEVAAIVEEAIAGDR